MSNFLDDCRAYVIRLYESKSRRYWRFTVLAATKSDAVDMVMEYAEFAIGGTCKLKKVTKLPNKAQVIDFSED